MFAKVAGEFGDDAGSNVVMAAAAAAAPPLLFGENYLGIDGVPAAAAEAAAVSSAAAHHAIARHFVSKCFEKGSGDEMYPFVGLTDAASLKFPGQVQSDGGYACKMVITHLMCCGCIMSAGAMVTTPLIIALMARWGFVRWLADIAHVCVQCLLAAEEALKTLAPPPSRTAVSAFLQLSASSASSSSPTSSVPVLVEHMRCRLRVVFDYLQAEAALLQHRPELALQQLQHSAAALAGGSSAHAAIARIICDEARSELEVGLVCCSQAVLGGTSVSLRSFISEHESPLAPGDSGTSRSQAALPSSSSSAAAAAAAPPLLLLRSYTLPQSKRTR
jgi:hypothetical protein